MRRRTCRNDLKRPSGRFFGPDCPLLIVAALLVTAGLQGQKRVQKTLLEPTVESVVIDGAQCFHISLETADTQEVWVEAEIDGEYQNEVLVYTETLGNTLQIGTGFTPGFQMPNDKLGAHKTLSVKLRVVLPSHQRVALAAGSCRVETKGNFRDLKIHITGGGCLLEHTAEHTEVTTASAPITAQIGLGMVQAHSRYGRVALETIPSGPSEFIFSSTSGDIRVSRKP